MKGIIFTEPNFYLTVQGIKNQTRRIIKPKPWKGLELADGQYDNIDVSHTNKITKSLWVDDEGEMFRARYAVGDTVYLKEPYQYAITKDGSAGYGYFYGIGDIDFEEDYSWFKEIISDAKWQKKYEKDGDKKQNKLFMPASAARYFIKITDVRAERLQDISDVDCESEGVSPVWENGFVVGWSNKSDGKTYEKRRESYAALIDNINGAGAWESNPFVWVYDYELTNIPAI